MSQQEEKIKKKIWRLFKIPEEIEAAAMADVMDNEHDKHLHALVKGPTKLASRQYHLPHDTGFHDQPVAVLNALNDWQIQAVKRAAITTLSLSPGTMA